MMCLQVYGIPIVIQMPLSEVGNPLGKIEAGAALRGACAVVMEISGPLLADCSSPAVTLKKISQALGNADCHLSWISANRPVHHLS